MASTWILCNKCEEGQGIKDYEYFVNEDRWKFNIFVANYEVKKNQSLTRGRLRRTKDQQEEG